MVTSRLMSSQIKVCMNVLGNNQPLLLISRKNICMCVMKRLVNIGPEL
jgi:hypothetical protein